MKILAIDDSGTMRNLISRCLEKIGYKNVTLCDSGAKAIKTLSTDTFDLVLLDWHMSGVDGLAVLKHIKTSKYKDTPVIMLTVEQEKEKIMQAINNGADDYMLKPLNPKMLKEKIKKVTSPT